MVSLAQAVDHIFDRSFFERSITTHHTIQNGRLGPVFQGVQGDETEGLGMGSAPRAKAATRVTCSCFSESEVGIDGAANEGLAVFESGRFQGGGEGGHGLGDHPVVVNGAGGIFADIRSQGGEKFCDCRIATATQGIDGGSVFQFKVVVVLGDQFFGGGAAGQADGDGVSQKGESVVREAIQYGKQFFSCCGISDIPQGDGGEKLNARLRITQQGNNGLT